MLAHGGVAGAIAEALVALAVAGVLLAVWIRERHGGGDRDDAAEAELREHDSE